MNNDDEKILDFDQEPTDNNEIKEAVDRFFQAVQNKRDEEIQREIEKLSTEDIKKKIVNLASSKFSSACSDVAASIATVKMLGNISDDAIDDMVGGHAALQVLILQCLGISEDDMFNTIKDIEVEFINNFVKQHSNGAHKGCIMDEYQKRVGEEWPEDIGGDVCH